MVSSWVKFVPLVLAVIASVISFLQSNTSFVPDEAVILTVLTLVYAILHEYETPSTTTTP